jgi:hypothetical protein
MKPIITLLAVAWLTTAASGGAPPPGDNPEKPYYVKVEAKGELRVEPNYRFDPKADVKSGQGTGAWIMAGSAGALPAYFGLLAEDHKHFDFMKANTGKRVIVTGELETYISLPPIGSSQWQQKVSQVIRVRDIRQSEPK